MLILLTELETLMGWCRPTIKKIIKAKSVQEYKPDPYVATVLNCAMWSFYGMPFVTSDDILVLTINGAGLVLELAYVSIFIIYSNWATRVTIYLFIDFSIISAVVMNFQPEKKKSGFLWIFVLMLQKKIFIALALEAAFLVVVVVITILALPTLHARSMLVGMISIIFNIIMYTSPLTVMVRRD